MLAVRRSSDLAHAIQPDSAGVVDADREQFPWSGIILDR